jgi:RimJ/RimL family protein N-acetyltransferase
MIQRLETERLVLRALRLDDVDKLVALDSDPAVMRYINGGKPTPRRAVEEFIRDSLGHRWLGFERSTDQFVGWVGLPVSDGSQENRELGYRLQRQAWGRGFATEGSRALIESAFKKLGTNRIWAQTMTVNTASRRVLERCGLHYVRTFNAEWPERIEGSEFGDVEYEILKAEWEALSAFREEWTENRKPGPRSV